MSKAAGPKNMQKIMVVFLNGYYELKNYKIYQRRKSECVAGSAWNAPYVKYY